MPNACCVRHGLYGHMLASSRLKLVLLNILCIQDSRNTLRKQRKVLFFRKCFIYHKERLRKNFDADKQIQYKHKRVEHKLEMRTRKYNRQNYITVKIQGQTLSITDEKSTKLDLMMLVSICVRDTFKELGVMLLHNYIEIASKYACILVTLPMYYMLITEHFFN